MVHFLIKYMLFIFWRKKEEYTLQKIASIIKRKITMFLKKYSMQVYPTSQHIWYGRCLYSSYSSLQVCIRSYVYLCWEKSKKDTFFPTPSFLLLLTHIQKGFS